MPQAAPDQPTDWPKCNGAQQALALLHRPAAPTRQGAGGSGYGAWIIEDEVYAPLADNLLPPMIARAPERVFYVGSLSKIASRGLLLLPPRAFLVDDRSEAAGLRVCLGPPPLTDLERGLKLFKQIATQGPSGQRAHS